MVLTIEPFTIATGEITVRFGVGRTPPGPITAPINARLAAALAHPNPRTVAGADPITRQVASGALGFPNESNISGGVDYQPNSPLIRYTNGEGYEGFAAYIWYIKQYHIDGTAAFYNDSYGQEIRTASPSVEFILNSRAQRLHFFIDGVKTNAIGYVDMPNDTGYRRIKISTGSTAIKRIRMIQEGDALPNFGAVRVESGYTLLAPAPTYPCNAIVIGDSFWAPSFPLYHINGLGTLVQEALGIDQFIPAASGGTGFVNASGKANYAQRIVNDMTLAPTDDPQIDFVLIAPSGNDISGNMVPTVYATVPLWLAAYETNVNFTLATARAAWPGAEIAVIDFAVKENLAMQGRESMVAVLEAACAANNCRWVPGVTAAMAALSTETRDSYFHVDGHPNDAGHAWLAATINTLIRAALA